jgi:hypothetical protein
MLLPAATSFAGDAVLVTARSDWPEVATVILTVALLLFGFGSVVVDETCAVSVMSVPAETLDATLTTTVMISEEPELSTTPELAEHVSVPLATPQVQPLAGLGVAETNVVLAGMASVKVTLLAALGPLLVMVCVYVMSPL